MHFSLPSVAAALALAGSASAMPAEKRQTTVQPPAEYYLQTKVVSNGNANGDCGTSKDGLYVVSYHTGAGLGDATLDPDISSAARGYLNGTQQLFNITQNDEAGWPMQVGYEAYTEFDPVTISISGPSSTQEGFFFNETGLQYNQSFAGWLACDWWHNVPQLFNLAGDYAYLGTNGKYPSVCSVVQLYPVAV